MLSHPITSSFVLLVLVASSVACCSNAMAQSTSDANSRPEFIRSTSPLKGGGTVTREAVEGRDTVTFVNVPPRLARDNRTSQQRLADSASRDNSEDRSRSFYRQSDTGSYPYPAGNSSQAANGSSSSSGGANSQFATNSQWANNATGELGGRNQNTNANGGARVADNRGFTSPTAFRQAANQAPSLNPNAAGSFGAGAPRPGTGNLGLGPVNRGIFNAPYNRGGAPNNRLAQYSQPNCNCNTLPAPPTNLNFNPGFQGNQGFQGAANNGYQQQQFGFNQGGYNPNGYNPNGYGANGNGASGYAFNNNIGTPQFGNQSSRWWTPFLTGSGQYTPLLAFRNMPQGTYLGQGLIGQPTAYVDGQPLRNLFRYIAP